MNDCLDVGQQVCIVGLTDFPPFLFVFLELFTVNVLVSFDVFADVQDEGFDDENQSNKVPLFKFNLLPVVIVWLTEEDGKEIFNTKDVFEGNTHVFAELCDDGLFDVDSCKVVDQIHDLYDHKSAVLEKFLVGWIDACVKGINCCLEPWIEAFQAVVLEDTTDVRRIEDVCFRVKTMQLHHELQA